MKSFLLFIAFVCAIALSSSAPPVTKAAGTLHRERAVMKFDQPVQLLGKTLKGVYLFVHDDAAMMRGDSCTYVYKGESDTADKLVVSFHCVPAFRDKVLNFTVRTLATESGQYELREFQFAGSNESHLVPLTEHSGHVNVTALN